MLHNLFLLFAMISQITISLCISIPTDLSRFYVLQYSDIYTECSQLTSNYKHVIKGTQIFSEGGITSDTLSDVTFTGWFLLKGSRPQNYLLFSVKDNYDNIFTLYYNLATSFVTYDLLANANKQLPCLIVKNTWYFIIVKLVFDTSLKTLTVDLKGITDNSPLSDTSGSSAALIAGLPNEFNKNRMQVIFGYNPIVGLYPTCTIVRYVMKIK